MTSESRPSSVLSMSESKNLKEMIDAEVVVEQEKNTHKGRLFLSSFAISPFTPSGSAATSELVDNGRISNNILDILCKTYTSELDSRISFSDSS